MSDEGIQKIKDFQDGDGWFHNGHRKFIEIGEELMQKGFTESEAIDLLDRVYSIVRNEYGD